MKRCSHYAILALALLLFTPAVGVSADTITGDWGGKRSGMEEAGYTFEAVYTGEGFINTSGGIDEDTGYLDNFDVTLEIDAEQAFGWNGATLFVYGLVNNGDDPSGFVGDAQGTSNIEQDETAKLYEAWINQQFGDNLAVLFGLYDLNGEFDVTETAGLFLGSSHGIGPDYSQSGVNGPSIFPTTSLALRLSYQVSEPVYAQMAILDGVSGDPTQPMGTQVEINGNDGWLIALEGGHVTGLEEGDSAPYRKYSLGGWYYTEEAAHVDGVSPDEKAFGIYAIADRAVSDRLSAFLRLGFASEDVHQFGTYVGLGGVYTGLFGREDDQLGLAVAHAINGGAFSDANPGAEDAETAIELTYRTQLTPWLALQPDVQYVISPGTDPTLDDALITSLRFEAAL